MIGGIFVIEALSVAIQVVAFQRFRTRVFLMAPIHHHFELLGWSETKIILRFWIVAAHLRGDRLHPLPAVDPVSRVSAGAAPTAAGAVPGGGPGQVRARGRGDAPAPTAR